MNTTIRYIYKITCLINNKIYIGQTVNPKKRWYEHKRKAKNIPSIAIQKAIKKYGEQNFKFEIIAGAKGLDDSNELEIILINQYKSLSPKGYNIAKGGSVINIPKELLKSIPKKYPSETRKQIAIRYSQGESSTKLSKEFGIDENTVRSYCLEQNVTMRGIGKHLITDETRIRLRKRRHRPRLFSLEQENVIVSKYKSGTSSLLIAKEYGCSAPTIILVLNRHNVSIRRR